MIAWIFLVVVLAGVGKLIYDIQSNKKSNPTEVKNDTFVNKDAFQKLAGITPVDKNDEIRNMLVKNNIISPEQLVTELKKEFENSEFPAPDPSIPVVTAKLTTIGGSYEEKDPLASVPMSRVSKEAKQKMAEIAKEDINVQLEKNAEKFAALNANQKACGCGRSETGFCTGLHRIPKKAWAEGVREIPTPKMPKEIKEVMLGTTKPKRKYTKKAKN